MQVYIRTHTQRPAPGATGAGLMRSSRARSSTIRPGSLRTESRLCDRFVRGRLLDELPHCGDDRHQQTRYSQSYLPPFGAGPTSARLPLVRFHHSSSIPSAVSLTSRDTSDPTIGTPPQLAVSTAVLKGRCR